ncbi:MAG: hypothetical protein JJ920_12300 [Roseitalea sp.]|jgi:hypothetical protein|nr:hypothetical protein [Roseitalea sp.]MBO6720538.1 hypothetical protein [Roseitalea sp.]MBO6743685.1 hypothetical protein [Roseitalea sp.]
MTGTKPWYLSRTIMAAIVSILASGGAALGLPIEAAAHEGLTDAVLQLVSAAAGAVAIIGRIGATTQIR